MWIGDPSPGGVVELNDTKHITVPSGSELKVEFEWTPTTAPPRTSRSSSARSSALWSST